MLTVEREERRIVAVVPLVQRTKRTKKKKKNKKNKKKQHFMDVWRNIIFPVRRVWLALSARLKARKNGSFIVQNLFFFSFLFFSLTSSYRLNRCYFFINQSSQSSLVIIKHDKVGYLISDIRWSK